MNTTPTAILRTPVKSGAALRFVSIGECMVEMAPLEAANEFRMGFAGDTFNTAWYTRALRPDWKTCYVSRVGTDDGSRAMLEFIKKSGIDTSHIGRDAQRTVGLYLISLRDGERSFSYWRDHSAARLLAQDATLLEAATQDADLIFFSGITLAILDPVGRETLLQVAAAARARGKTIAFDSNLRPRLWANGDDMCHWITRAATVSDITLPSFEDETTWFADANPEATRDRYLNSGATTVIVKNGAGTVLYQSHGERGQVTPAAVGTVVDTTSAGDSFNAGFLTCIDQNKSLPDMIRTGAKVAGQVIGRKGALVPLDGPCQRL